MADVTLDAKGLMCPLPVLKARKALRGVPPGGTLEVWATDPNSPLDFTDFCAATGAILLAQEAEAGVFRFLLRRPAD